MPRSSSSASRPGRLARQSHATRRAAFFEPLEPRQYFDAPAFNLIQLTNLRADPTYSFLDGTGVSVAVIDTGLDKNHPDIAPNFRAGADIVNGGNNPSPTASHGTHVAGIVGATDPDIGVAPHVGLIGLQVFSQTQDGQVLASNTDIEKALQWVIDHRAQFKIVAVNMSLGSGFYTSAADAGPSIIQDDIQRLEAAGVTIVSAAGNSYKGHETRNSSQPGVYSTLDVGAVWQDGVNSNLQWGSGAIDFTTGPDRVTSFSQRPAGSNEIFAPGALINSTVPNNSFEREAGTSMASPMVAGCVALMQQAALRFGGRYLSPTEVRQIMQQTADTIFDGDDENDNVTNTNTSYKRVNIYKAVQRIKSNFDQIGGGGGGGGTTTPGDANGTIAGAYLGPTLDGSPVDAILGNIGTDGTATVIGNKDVDLFAITVASPGVLSVALSLPQGGTTFNSYLRLFDPNGAQLAANDDIGGGNTYSALSLAVTPGTYYVGVSGAPNSAYNPNTAASGVAGATGDYSMALSLSNSDPNGLISGAFAVNLGTDLAPATFDGNIGTDYGQAVGTSDVDLFKIVVPDNGTLSIAANTPFNTPPLLDTYLRVFDADGNELAFSDDNPAPNDTNGHTTDSFIVGGVNRGDVYYIGVSDFNNRAYNANNLTGRPTVGTGGLYQLVVTFASNDQNGSISQAVDSSVVGLPATKVLGRIGFDTNFNTGQGFDVGSRDVDFFKITSPTAGILEVDINAYDNAPDLPLGPVDAVVTIWDAAGNRLAQDDDFNGSRDPFVQFPILAGTVYYISVSGYGNDTFNPFALGSGSDGDTGAYYINTRLLAASKNADLSDNAISNPGVTVLALDTEVSGTLGRDGAFATGNNDVDLYRFEPTATGPVRFATSTSGTDTTADTFLRLFDADGIELAFNDNASISSTMSEIVFNVSAGTTYYVGVSGAGAGARSYDPVTGGGAADGSTGDYTLTATVGPTLSVAAASVVEGNAGTVAMNFTVTLSRPVSADVSVNYSTSDASAVAPGDYQSASGTLTIPAGQTTGTITVLVNGDTLVEGDEIFRLNLSNPVNAALATTQAIGTIRDDDAPPPVIIVGPVSGDGGTVRVFRSSDRAALYTLNPYGSTFAGGVRVAAGDVNGDGTSDIITGPGPGAAPTVKVFDGKTHLAIASFNAFAAGFRGGVFVAAGDVNGDGRADIIVGTGSSASTKTSIKVFNGANLSQTIFSFSPFAANFRGGVFVAAGDVNGDRRADVIAGSGPGMTPTVKVFSGLNRAVVSNFVPYAASFNGGVAVAAGDLDGDGQAEVLTSPASGAAATIKAFAPPSSSPLISFNAYSAGFRGGAFLAAVDLNGDGNDDILTSPGPGTSPKVRGFSGSTLADLLSFFPLPTSSRVGIYLAAGR